MTAKMNRNKNKTEEEWRETKNKTQSLPCSTDRTRYWTRKEQCEWNALMRLLFVWRRSIFILWMRTKMLWFYPSLLLIHLFIHMIRMPTLSLSLSLLDTGYCLLDLTYSVFFWMKRCCRRFACYAICIIVIINEYVVRMLCHLLLSNNRIR